ncbi:hypothetical protein [Stagnihabitans tardus]|uniref:Uncharacterized protein n=1 Tax=Stagnihabitans tardus TaxID=2699202 RepID=A0AAE4Y6E3_9RHOB|nr:hypothetical protein [Stagnihabitans tardus]NBZ86683.1 hypothetical protein [Stagnihabitans tardus]
MAPGCPDFEELCEFALGYLITGRGDARQLAATMVKAYPDLPVLELVLILSSAASGLESTFSNAEARAQAVDAWRIAALLAVDLHLMAGHHAKGQKARDLLGFWEAEDDFFLRAG